MVWNSVLFKRGTSELGTGDQGCRCGGGERLHHSSLRTGVPGQQLCPCRWDLRDHVNMTPPDLASWSLTRSFPGCTPLDCLLPKLPAHHQYLSTCALGPFPRGQGPSLGKFPSQTRPHQDSLHPGVHTGRMGFPPATWVCTTVKCPQTLHHNLLGSTGMWSLCGLIERDQVWSLPTPRNLRNPGKHRCKFRGAFGDPAVFGLQHRVLPWAPPQARRSVWLSTQLWATTLIFNVCSR